MPGWHQPCAAFDLMVKPEVWAALSEPLWLAICVACDDVSRAMLIEGKALQPAALRTAAAADVLIRRWPRAVVIELERRWREIAAGLAEDSAEFDMVWRSYTDFRRDGDRWRRLSRM